MILAAAAKVCRVPGWVSLACLFIGCASEAPVPRGERVVIPIKSRAPSASPSAPSSEPGGGNAPDLAAVESAFQGGDVARAAQLLDSIPMSSISSPERERYTRLRVAVRRAQIRELYLLADTKTDSFSGELGDTIRLSLTLANRAEVPISIPAARSTGFLGFGKGEQSVVEVEIDYLEYDRHGSRYELSWQRSLSLPHDLDLQPGETITIPFTVDTSDERLRPQRVVFRRLVIEPTLWPLSIQIGSGKSAFLAPIPFKPATIDVLPPGGLALRSDPAAALRRALGLQGKADVANHVFLAGLLVLQSDPATGASILKDALSSGDPETCAAAISALRVATGDFAHDDPEAWRNWCADRVAGAR